MDNNKLLKLQQIGYRISSSCSLCLHGTFPQNDFGTCGIQTYGHLKHNDSVRQLSIHKQGSCGRFEANPVQIAKLGTYSTFLEGKVNVER